MLKLVLVRPGATDFDDQGRIKGTLDIPLNQKGADQVAQVVVDLADQPLKAIYASPCQAAQQSAELLADAHQLKVKTLTKLQNLDHGLWHGKRIEEVKQFQPKVYRQWQDNPETVCPPEGESLPAAELRIRESLGRMIRRHREGAVVVVCPEPVASLIAHVLEDRELGDLWKVECECGGWETINVVPERVASEG